MQGEQVPTYQQYVINDKGERIIPASQRADGSWREEIKVRAGYVPQEEVGLYVAPHVAQSRIRKQGNFTPGLEYEEEEENTAVPKQKSKNQKKRERKKAREQQQIEESVSSQQQQQQNQSTINKLNESVEGGRAALEGLQLGDRKQAKHTDSVDAGSCSQPGMSNQTEQSEVVRKQANKLRKKIRECENLRVKVEGGHQLSSEENKKLNQQQSWQEELNKLDCQLN